MSPIFLNFKHRLTDLFCRLKYKDISRKDASRDIFFGEDTRVITWPNGATFAFNLNLDDYSAKSLKNDRYDYGGAVGEGVNKLLTQLITDHPELKMTLFVIPNPRFINSEGTFYGRVKDERYSLDRPEYAPLVNWFKSHKDQVEVAAHGYDHLNPKTGLFLAPAEFEFLDKRESRERIQAGMRILRELGLGAKGFRPPMWGVGHNSNFALMRQLPVENFAYVSCSSPLSGLNWDKKRVSNIYPEIYKQGLELENNELLNLPQNVSLIWPIEKILSTIDRIADMGGLVSLMGHANTEDKWMADGIGPRNLAKIETVLAHLKEKYPGKVWFATLAEIADFWQNLATK